MPKTIAKKPVPSKRRNPMRDSRPTLGEHESPILLNKEDCEMILEMIENPPRASEKLKLAIEKSRAVRVRFDG